MKTTLARVSVWRTLLLSTCLALASSACESEQGDSSDTKVGSDDAAAGDNAWCEVKNLLDKKCIQCHDGKGSAGAPMGLTSYEELQADAVVSTGKKVFEAVSARIHDKARPMPPGGPLAAEQQALIDAWIAAGALAGDDASCASNPVTTAQDPVDVWPPPEGCDEIYKIAAHGATLDAPFLVQPGAEFHPQIAIDAPWGDETVQAIAFHPLTDNKKVLHHWILYANQGVSAFLNGWAPGDDARSPLPADVGMDMPTGKAALRLDLHYNSLTATGPEEDRSGVEICVVKGAHLRKVSAAVTMSLNAISFPLAPANTVNHAATGTCSVVGATPVHLLTASPHSHTYAIGHKFTVKKKSGQEIVMLDRPFVFGEQKSYGLTPEVLLEEGDTVTTTCFYTNNTNQGVSFGENTGNEMCFNFATYYPKGALVCGGLSGVLGGLLGNAGSFLGGQQ